MATETPDNLNSSTRFHDLDALRAFAMLLGIFLHGFLSFIELPIWIAQDVHQPVWEIPSFLREIGLSNSESFNPFSLLLHAIHGFRMPLFFLVSGYFVAMTWKKRGMKKLAGHRAKRILIPLVLGTILVWPMMIAVGIWGTKVKAEMAAKSGAEVESIWVAARTGNVAMLERALADGANLDRPGSAGITPLALAAIYDHPAVLGKLLEEGADPNAANQDGATALHAAAFLGRSEIVEQLLAAGADPNAKNQRKDTPLAVLEVDFGTTQWIAGMLKVEIDRQELEAGRDLIRPMLVENGAVQKGEAETEQSRSFKQMVMQGAMFPMFHHLWFLHYLVWLIAGFVVIVFLWERVGWSWKPSLGCVMALTLVPQFFMVFNFGPDTATGIIPWPPKLLYYACFFTVGALGFCHGNFGTRASRSWPLLLGLALLTFFAALYCFHERGTILGTDWNQMDRDVLSFHLAYSLLAVTYAWLMIFGMLGLFRRCFSFEHPAIRYVSDASYWLYVAHLPIILALQVGLSPLDAPLLAKLTIICGATIGGLLLIYEVAVRYTWIGAMLNGRKTRPAKLASD